MHSRQITYCTNIHPGESWSEIRENQDKHVLYVKNNFCPEHVFPLGLRLSARAAEQIQSKEIEEFRHWCHKNSCFPITINGFPYGDFHGGVIKETVYDPDWRCAERVAYTCRLAEILAAWWSGEKNWGAYTLSISSVPIGFKGNFNEYDWPIVYKNIVKTLSFLEQLHARQGVKIMLALEPEPSCVLEETTEVIDFFQRIPLNDNLRAYLGVCLDCCHQAVEFENPEDVLKAYKNHDIPIAKVQVSSALWARNVNEIRHLMAFDESTYLHQSIIKNKEGELRRFVDLPDMAAFMEASYGAEDAHFADECRVHFHVPVFLEHLGSIGTTQAFIKELIPLLDDSILLEVETYSFSVLPKAMQLDSVDDAIIRELNWVKGVVNASHGST